MLNKTYKYLRDLKNKQVKEYQGLEFGSTQLGVSIRKFFALTLGCDFGLVGLVVVFVSKNTKVRTIFPLGLRRAVR